MLLLVFLSQLLSCCFSWDAVFRSFHAFALRKKTKAFWAENVLFVSLYWSCLGQTDLFCRVNIDHETYIVDQIDNSLLFCVRKNMTHWMSYWFGEYFLFMFRTCWMGMIWHKQDINTMYTHTKKCVIRVLIHLFLGIKNKYAFLSTLVSDVLENHCPCQH